MEIKKLLIIVLIIIILALQFSWLRFDNKVYATENYAIRATTNNIAKKYFYNQLTNDSKVFYEVMEEMLAEGELKKGNVSREITGISNLETKLDEYAAGSQELLNAMGAARDAFVCDYPDLFYVDFDYFSMRVTMKEGKKHLYIGTGRGDNYVNKEFLREDNTVDTEKIDEAINTVNAKVNAIVEKAKAKEDDLKTGQDLIEQQIKIAHEEVIKAAKYTFEYQTKHPYTVRTIYGVFGLEGEGNVVCEGYSRALKTILDKLDIPCILVRGIYRQTANQPEEHMWVYAQLSDGKWYAIDPTFDNTDEIENGEENVSQEFFLVGQDVMYKHVPTGILSTSNYEFTYPSLEPVSDRFDVVYNYGLIKVEMDDENGDLEGSPTSVFRISYNGHGYQKAIEEDGVYIVMDMYQEGKDGTTASSGWVYPIPELYGYDGSPIVYTDEYIEFRMPHINYFQVGVTDIAPLPFKMDERDLEKIARMTSYFGEQTGIINKSEIIQNPNGDYIAPPYVKKVTPAVNSVQYIGQTYPITIEYDDVLIPTGEEDISVEVMILDALTQEYRDASDPITVGGQTNPRMQYKITDFNFDGQDTFTFNFTPSEMWADDSVYYIFKFNGVVGSRSKKPPMATSYGCAYPCSAYAYTAQGYNLNVYGKPVLMDDVDMNGIELDGMSSEEINELSDILKHRLTLVTTKTTKADEASMEENLENYLQEKASDGETPDVFASETYNINLTLCNKQQKELKDGVGVRIMLGFPAGYGPDDEGVTFKAYHYKKDTNGNIIGVEEIPCTITKLGLIIEVKSFSPFTIAAMEPTAEDLANTDKTVVFNVTEGGNIEKNDNGAVDTVIKLKQGENQQYKIKAAEGYEIDEIMVGDKNIQVSEDLTEYSLDLKYEELTEDNTMIKVAFATESVHQSEKEEGATIVTQPVVNNPSFTMTANTYKDVKDSDSSIIKSKVTTLNPNDEFEVVFSLAELNNIGKGINTIKGILDYDNEKLELISCEKTELWNIQHESSTKEFTATTTDSNPITQPCDVYVAKFKVRGNAAGTANISLNDLQAKKTDEGEDPKAVNITTVVNITAILDENLELKSEATAKHISIKENHHIILPDHITFDEFNNLVNSSQTPKYHTNIEGTYDEESKTVTNSKLELIGDNTGAHIQTGDTISVGNTVWTFAVCGDIDGDGDASTTNDLAKAKLHYIGKQVLAGAYLEAADTDLDSEGATVNDIARLKLKLIEKINSFFED